VIPEGITRIPPVSETNAILEEATENPLDPESPAIQEEATEIPPVRVSTENPDATTKITTVPGTHVIPEGITRIPPVSETNAIQEEATESPPETKPEIQAVTHAFLEPEIVSPDNAAITTTIREENITSAEEDDLSTSPEIPELLSSIQIKNTGDESQQKSLSDDTATLLEEFAELYDVKDTNEMRTVASVSFGACDIGFGNGNFYYKGIVRSINDCALRALEDRGLNNAYINAVVTTETKIIESSESVYFDCYIKINQTTFTFGNIQSSLYYNCYLQ